MVYRVIPFLFPAEQQQEKEPTILGASYFSNKGSASAQRSEPRRCLNSFGMAQSSTSPKPFAKGVPCPPPKQKRVQTYHTYSSKEAPTTRHTSDTQNAPVRIYVGNSQQRTNNDIYKTYPSMLFQHGYPIFGVVPSPSDAQCSLLSVSHQLLRYTKITVMSSTTAPPSSRIQRSQASSGSKNTRGAVGLTSKPALLDV